MSEIEDLDDIEVIDGQEVEAEPEKPEPEESAPQEEENQEPEPKEEEGKKKEVPTGVQKKINKLTKRYYQERAEKEQLRQRLSELEKAPQPASARPRLEEFDYDEDKYQEALVDYKVNQALISRDQQFQSQQVKTEAERRAEEFNKKVEDSGIPFEEYNESFNNLIDARIPFSDDVIAAIQVDENGAHLTHYLGSNLDVADKIAGMTTTQAALELGKISANLKAGRTKKITKAPDPVKTVGSGSGKVTKDITNASMDDIMADDSI
jgi:hypothetical protein